MGIAITKVGGGEKEYGDYIIVKEIGKGGFGKAYIVRHKADPNNEQFVMKIIKESKQEKEKIIKEVNILKSLNHPMIIKYRNHFESHKGLCIVMDFASGGTLKQLINSKVKMELRFHPDEIYQLVDQLIFGVKYLHKNNIVHRDLKPDNIFLTQDLNIKFGDFGLASNLQIGEYTKIDMGTLIYMSPELIRQQEHKLEPDIWAVGCIIYEILTLTKAFNGIDRLEIQMKIANGNFDISLLNEENHCSEGLSKLVQSMLTVDRKSRSDIFTISSDLLKLQSTWELPLPILDKTLGKNEEEKVIKKGEISMTQKAIAQNKEIEKEIKIKEENKLEIDYLKKESGKIWKPEKIAKILKSDEIKDDLKPLIISQLVKSNNMTEINLSSKHLGDKGIRILCEGLKETKNLKLLNLGNNDLTNEGEKYVQNILLNNQNIEDLYIESNYDIKKEGIRDICSALEMNNRITKLNIGWCKAGGGCAEYIGKLIKKNNSIKDLNIWGMDINDKRANYIWDALRDNTTIHTLDFGYNYCGDGGVKNIFDMLKYNQSLRTLDLRDNKLSYEGIKSISDGLLNNNSLQQLYLKGNSIDKKGGECLGNLLSINTALKNLNLYGCKMGDNEIKSICKGLEKNNSITNISLGWNKCGENGMENIAHMLQHNQTIQELELYSMGISDEGLQILSQGMKKNISLAKLNLGGNSEITDKGIKYLYEAVKIRENHILDVASYGCEKVGEEGKNMIKEMKKGLKLQFRN